MPFIYQIKNVYNDKIYIGSTKNTTKRMQSHFCYAKMGKGRASGLHAFMREKNYEGFTLEILKEIESTDKIDRFQAEEDAMMEKIGNGIPLFNINRAFIHPSIREEYWNKIRQEKCKVLRRTDPSYRAKCAAYDHARWMLKKEDEIWHSKRNEQKRAYYKKKREDPEYSEKERERNKLRMREKRKKLRQEAASETERPPREA